MSYTVLVSCMALLAARLLQARLCQSPHEQLMVLDTDPGGDDAVAIFTSLGDCSTKVLAITCVRGNTDVPQVVINTLKILKLANSMNIPVFKGDNSGLVESPKFDYFFGKDGLQDLPYSDPPSLSILQSTHAATFLATVVDQYPGNITILSIGPLTNIALATHLNPNFLKQAKSVIVTGGTMKGLGNVRPGIEFNFYMDPDAAVFVLTRALADGILLKHLPLETVQDQELGMDWRWNELAKINNSAVSFMNALEQAHLKAHPSLKYHPLDIYSTAAALSDQVVIRTTPLFGLVENKGQISRGLLLLDYNNKTKNPANLDVITCVNTTVIRNVMMANLANLSSQSGP